MSICLPTRSCLLFACLQIIKDLQLLAMVAALVLADAVLLLTWVFSDPVQCFRSLSVSLRVKG